MSSKHIIGGLVLLAGLALTTPARAQNCDCNKECCPPCYKYTYEGAPKIKYKCGCPKPICDPCHLPHYGYYQTCWGPWTFPADWDHCPVPPPAALVPAIPPRRLRMEGSSDEKQSPAPRKVEGNTPDFLPPATMSVLKPESVPLASAVAGPANSTPPLATAVAGPANSTPPLATAVAGPANSTPPLATAVAGPASSPPPESSPAGPTTVPPAVEEKPLVGPPAPVLPTSAEQPVSTQLPVITDKPDEMPATSKVSETPAPVTPPETTPKDTASAPPTTSGTPSKETVSAPPSPLPTMPPQAVSEPAPKVDDAQPQRPRTVGNNTAGPAMRMVNSRRVLLDYEVTDVPSPQQSMLELWFTQDGHKWFKDQLTVKCGSPYVVEVGKEGTYGFTLVARMPGEKSEPPAPSEAPQVWVEVDWTRPTVNLVDAKATQGSKGRSVSIAWTATDNNMAQKPITLSYSAQPQGPWETIAANLENTGRYVWEVPTSVPSNVHLRIEAADLVGNVGSTQTTTPVQLP